MPTYLAGFSLGLSLILAIGAQNAFVLKQGLKNQHLFLVCLVCALSDAILIILGVAGFGTVVKKFPEIEPLARYGGAIFLSAYAFLSIKSAFTKSHNLEVCADIKETALRAVSVCLAFTWLNPHVYLDTVVLLGAISIQYDPNQAVFAAGAASASFIFFFSLGYGARVLLPLFSSPRSWKVLDFLVGLTMLSIAASLVFRETT